MTLLRYLYTQPVTGDDLNRPDVDVAEDVQSAVMEWLMEHCAPSMAVYIANTYYRAFGPDVNVEIEIDAAFVGHYDVLFTITFGQGTLSRLP